jgi:hypothetical protein
MKLGYSIYYIFKGNVFMICRACNNGYAITDIHVVTPTYKS